MSACAMVAAPRSVLRRRDGGAVVETVGRAEAAIARNRGAALLQCHEVAVRSGVFAVAVLRAPAIRIGLCAADQSKRAKRQQAGKRRGRNMAHCTGHEKPPSEMLCL